MLCRGRDWKRSYPSNGCPAAFKAAFWNTGDSECATGWPSRTSWPGSSLNGFSAAQPVEQFFQLLLQQVGGLSIGIQVTTVWIRDSLVGDA